MAVPPKSDSFATFLESLRRYSQEKQAGGSDGAPLKLLALLAEGGGQTVPELMGKSGLGFTEFADALRTMREAGLLTLTGASGQEVVHLTSSGEQVAGLVR